MDRLESVIGLSSTQVKDFVELADSSKSFFTEISRWNFDEICRTSNPVIVRGDHGFVRLRSKSRAELGPKDVKNLIGSNLDEIFVKTSMSFDISSKLMFKPHTSSNNKTYVVKEMHQFVQRNHTWSRMHLDFTSGTCHSPRLFKAIKIWVLFSAYDEDGKLRPFETIREHRHIINSSVRPDNVVGGILAG